MIDLETEEVFEIDCDRLKGYNGSLGWWTVEVQDHHITNLYRYFLTHFIWLEGS